MDILYAPWRDTYVTGTKENQDQSQQNLCVFCQKFSDYEHGKQEFVMKKTEHLFVILNLYPYNGGHLLILPKEHVANLQDLSQQVRAEFMELMNASIEIVKNVLQAQGVNVGFNLGSAAGAGIPSHLHCHIVPRWSGDTSFITVIGKTKNVSVDLEKIYHDLKPAFEKLEM